MSEDTTGKTYSFDVCAQCKIICCQGANPPLTLKRKKLITDYLKTQNLPVKNPFVCEEYSHPAVGAMQYCVFYNKKTGKCRVHQVKPETCKAGPITFDINLRTRKIEWFLKKEEICALAQRLGAKNDKLREHLEAAKVEILCLVCELDADSLRAILRIEEPQTIKIGEDDLSAEVLKKLEIS
jgi:uncharacterized protein